MQPLFSIIEHAPGGDGDDEVDFSFTSEAGEARAASGHDGVADDEEDDDDDGFEFINVP